MRAMLLAAGLGTRLQPLTDSVPKCLVPIKGQPLLGIWLESLSKAGLGPFLVNTHYLGEQVENFIEQSEFSEMVTLVFEPKLLGTAGTLITNLDFFEGQDGMLIHADNYCMADLSDFVLAHQNRPSNCLMTMMTFRTLDPSSCGIIDLDERGIVRQLYEKIDNPPGNLANGAVYILSRQLIEMLRCNSDNIHDFSLQILPNLIGHIFTFETQETFIDIGTPEAYSRANRIDFV
jgi:mannose-1-phosphate guanylyltransferase